ncbi:(2Fe-2S)-binding protein [Actinomycetospora aeridis]|uniref:(2Fe-2S)-binding protein n=1 Tax=Actinomycetospora aeridis TaxID=3129231 RepID=A0ABU8N5L4_9PSEU
MAASLLLEGYAQRVVPPAIAAQVLLGRSVDTEAGRVHVRLEDGRVRQVAFATPDGAEGGVAGVDGLTGVVEPLHRRTRAGRRVLAGAVAHAVAVAFVHLSWPSPDRARHLEDARDLLAGAGLPDLVHLEAAGVPGVPGVVEGPWLYAERRTCCLAFRTDRNRARGPSYCATCPVVPEEERRRSFREAVVAYARRSGER